MQPSHKRKLNQKQLDLLELMYRFRFLTAPLLTRLEDRKPEHRAVANSRLRILLSQEYLGRFYTGEMRVRGESAIYYLKQKGVSAIKNHLGEDFVPRVGKNLSRDENATDQFIDHWLKVLEFYCEVREAYPDADFFTQNELAHPRYEYMPRPLPDGYLQINDDVHFFVDYIDASALYFKLTKRVKEYAAYAEEGKWAIMPGVILICATQADQSRLHKKLPFMAGSVQFYTVLAEDAADIKNAPSFRSVSGDRLNLNEVIASYSAAASV